MRTKEIIKFIKQHKSIAEGSMEECIQEFSNTEEADRYAGEVRACDYILDYIKNWSHDNEALYQKPQDYSKKWI